MSVGPNPVQPRFRLATTVMLRVVSGTAVLAELKNISLSGCYLETPCQIPEGARVRVVLQTTGIHADLCGVVQRRDATGLGIRFTNGATVEDWKRLETFINEVLPAVAAKGASAGQD
jgi:hypothetical protein